MTRFLMSLADSVDLVQFAFENAQSGDLFIKKAPASTVEVLLQALVEMFDINDALVKSIGIRHGEKVYESLLSTEERVNSEDLGDFFRVPLDTRTLDYSVYFEDGEQRPADVDSYTSHNTTRLNVSEVKKLLLQLPEIQSELSK